jgi:thymidine phosphorylase
MEDKIDHAAGIRCLKKIGSRVARGEPLALLYANSRERLTAGRKLAAAAFRIGKKYVKPPRLIVAEIS